MQPEINYTMVGQRIRTARLQKKLCLLYTSDAADEL